MGHKDALLHGNPCPGTPAAAAAAHALRGSQLQEGARGAASGLAGLGRSECQQESAGRGGGSSSPRAGSESARFRQKPGSTACAPTPRRRPPRGFLRRPSMLGQTGHRKRSGSPRGVLGRLGRGAEHPAAELRFLLLLIHGVGWGGVGRAAALQTWTAVCGGLVKLPREEGARKWR